MGGGPGHERGRVVPGGAAGGEGGVAGSALVGGVLEGGGGEGLGRPSSTRARLARRARSNRKL